MEFIFAAILNGMWASTDVILYSARQITRNTKQPIAAAERKRQFRNLLLQLEDLDRLFNSFLAYFYKSLNLCVILKLFLLIQVHAILS